MLKVLWQGLRMSPVAVIAALFLLNPAIAQEMGQDVAATQTDSQPEAGTTDPAGNLLQQIEEYNPVNVSLQEAAPLDQVNSVNQLSDVSPRDWAYSALQNIAQTYDCLFAYPDGTYRGNRALTRYEFAAGLNACLETITKRIEELGTGIPDIDLATLRQLTEEFSAELTLLRGRVDSIEARVAEVEANQFSTTTKLNATAIFAVGDTFGGTNDDSQTFFSDRVRLNFDTSFTGKDRLRTRIQLGNTPNLASATDPNTNMARLGFDGGNNNAELADLYYRFPLSDNVTAYFGPVGLDLDDIPTVVNPALESGDDGALSRFGRYNPAVYRQAQGAGGGITAKFGAARLDLAYLSGSGAASPTSKNGLFNGSHSALAQLTLKPTENIDVAFTYVNSYYPGFDVNMTGSTGSSLAQRPFGRLATTGNNFGVQASLNFKPVILSAWGGYTSAVLENSGNGFSKGNTADIWNWAVNVAAEVGPPGSQLAFIFGMPPKLTDIDRNGNTDTDTSFHIEGLYRYRLSRNIDITPGFFVITNPNHNDNNDSIWVGTLRTTFKF